MALESEPNSPWIQTCGWSGEVRFDCKRCHAYRSVPEGYAESTLTILLQFIERHKTCEDV